MNWIERFPGYEKEQKEIILLLASLLARVGGAGGGWRADL